MSRKVIIVDDEKLAVAGLEKLISKHCPDLQLIASCTTFKDSLKAINTLKPDIVFLDIEMPQANGFELLDLLSYKNFKLIFTTAYANYAIKAIKAHASDYLLKPIDPEELKKAVEAIEIVNPAITDGEQLIINTQDSIFYVKQQEIMYLKSDGNYTTIKTKSGKTIKVSQTLKKIEDKLSNENFLRIHHSYIVNTAEIVEYNKTSLKVSLSDETEIPVSIRKKKFIQK